MRELVSSYKLFIDRINDIRSFIKNIASTNSVWNSFENLTLSDNQKAFIDYMFSASGKTIQYNAVIISLYGCFENYVDSIFSKYLDFVFSGVDKYDDLPKKIKEKYKMKLGEYLTSPGRFSGIDISMTELIDSYLKTLNSNLKETNKTFLLMHSGNLKFDQLCHFMSEMGIDCPKTKIYRSALFRSFFFNTLGFDKAGYDLKVSRNSPELSSYLDKLVDQRNSVAHGWVEDNRISINDIESHLIPFIKTFAEVLLRIIICESMPYMQKTIDAPQISQIAVYHHNIVCFHTYGQDISIGDYLIYSSKDSFNCAMISHIEIDHKEYSCISNKECDIGLELDDRIAMADRICLFIPVNN